MEWCTEIYWTRTSVEILKIKCNWMFHMDNYPKPITIATEQWLENKWPCQFSNLNPIEICVHACEPVIWTNWRRSTMKYKIPTEEYSKLMVTCMKWVISYCEQRLFYKNNSFFLIVPFSKALNIFNSSLGNLCFYNFTL